MRKVAGQVWDSALNSLGKSFNYFNCNLPLLYTADRKGVTWPFLVYTDRDEGNMSFTIVNIPVSERCVDVLRACWARV